MIENLYFYTHHDGSISLMEDSDRFNRGLSKHLDRSKLNSTYYAKLRNELEKTNPTSDLDVFDRFPITEKSHYKNELQDDALKILGGEPFITDFSSGSTSQCVVRLSRPKEELCEQFAAEEAFRRIKINSTDHFVSMDIGASSIYDFYFRAARELGVLRCSFLHVTVDFESLAETLKSLKPTVMLSIPTIFAKMWPLIKDLWGEKCPVEKLIFIGEDLDLKFKSEIEEKWGCRIYSFYGTTEIGGMAANCNSSYGLHFNLDYFIPTLLNPKKIDEHIVEGEVLYTTPKLQGNSVIKYRVGDIVRISKEKCACGEATPRLWFVERTHQSFVLAGVKFRYEVFLEAFRNHFPKLDFLTIKIEEVESEGNKIMLTFNLPSHLSHSKKQFNDILLNDIYELDTLHQSGLIGFDFQFIGQDPTDLKTRKTKLLVDKRRWVGNEPALASTTHE